jgi:TetR/AcrR family transcriptional regulator, lmrAB and yxaGH operons repressor
MAADTRARMIEATVRALRERGVAGMSFTEVLRESGAARGAIYHHFPGGKAQMVAEAAEQNGQTVREVFATLPADDPAAVVEAFLALVRPVIEESAQGCGCAVAAATLGDEGDGVLRGVARIAFAGWTDQLADTLGTAGLDGARSRDVATTLVTLLEGAQVLCRAAGSVEPFEAVTRVARGLVA